jgi:MOSC domain-containing protein YiiM
MEVRHRSRVLADPTQPNLRQVHLIHLELIDELRDQGFRMEPAVMGENITTKGIDLPALPRDSNLRIGEETILRVTGLRNPCHQLDDYRPGLMQAVLDRDEEGNLVRKAGIVSVVETGGIIRRGDEVVVEKPPAPYRTLGCV